MILKVLGVALILDAIGSWFFDVEKQRKGDDDPPHMIEHVVRFVRMLIGLYMVTL